MNRKKFNEDFSLEVEATPDKVDIKSDGDDAKELEEFARCVLGDNFSFFNAFDDEDEDISDEEAPEEEIDAEEISADEPDAEDVDVDIEEGLLPDLGNLPTPPMPGLKEKCNKKKINELFDIDAGIDIATDKKTNGIELEEGDLNISLDAHDFGGQGNDVDVLSKPDLDKNIEEAFQKWLAGKKLVENFSEQEDLQAEFDAVVNGAEDPLNLKELYNEHCKNCDSKKKITANSEDWEDLWEDIPEKGITDDSNPTPQMFFIEFDDYSIDEVTATFGIDNFRDFSNVSNIDVEDIWAEVDFHFIVDFDDWKYEEPGYVDDDRGSYAISGDFNYPDSCNFRNVRITKFQLHTGDGEELSTNDFISELNINPDDIKNIKDQIINIFHSDIKPQLSEIFLEDSYFWEDEAKEID